MNLSGVKLLNFSVVSHNNLMMFGVDLVGREAEFDRLTRVLDDDSGRAVVVHGDPGIGKTALIKQVCTRAAEQGWRVVPVLGVVAEESFALGGLHQMVRPLEEFTPGLDERDRTVLAPVLGIIGQWRDSPPPPGNGILHVADESFGAEIQSPDPSTGCAATVVPRRTSRRCRPESHQKTANHIAM